MATRIAREVGAGAGVGSLVAAFEDDAGDVGAVGEAGRVVTLASGVGVGVAVSAAVAVGEGLAEAGEGEVVAFPVASGPQPVAAAARSTALTVPTTTAWVRRMWFSLALLGAVGRVNLPAAGHGAAEET
ncbi:hypothetical protein KV205_25520 [Streptomyces sp. SKN60]|uniref:hypothetical protein n=1 Tax=Streptomyces sp. SKN60 TaxID=2855506 RepID=UPI002245F95E|nr:hypothetical protein [Streptomyces sp. SKN60]MCX2183865.1 hypothetical protein [Streptomyces sp. SKN60]